jgi:hypothetical protein
MSESQFRYTTRFEAPIKTVYASKQGSFTALASLEEIKALAPAEMNIKENYDLLYTVFNSAVINRINKNHDGIKADVAVKIHKNFVHKPMNIEHNRKMVVGHIINAGFSEFKTNKVYTEEEAANSLNPFYLNLSAVVYKVSDPELCDILIDASDETSPNFNAVATSWELGFNDYQILLGHKDISEGELITDPKQIEAFSKYLRAYGGSGYLEDKTPVYRVIVGDVLPLGCGFTTMPAAEVEGVYVVNKPEKPEPVENGDAIDVSAPLVLEAAASNDTISSDILPEKENNYSQQKNNIVNIHSIMRLEDITDESLKEVSAANVREFLADEIEKISQEWEQKLAAKSDEVSSKTAEASELQQKLEALNTQIGEIKAELDSEKEARASEKALSDFNNRMSDLNVKYNLSDKDSEVIAKQIRGLDDDGFAAWFEGFSVLAAEKSKAHKSVRTEEAVASVEAVLDSAVEEPASGVPNVQTPVVNKNAAWANAFKLEDIVVIG